MFEDHLSDEDSKAVMRYLSGKYNLPNPSLPASQAPTATNKPSLSYEVLKIMETEFNKDSAQHSPVALVPVATGTVI